MQNNESFTDKPQAVITQIEPDGRERFRLTRFTRFAAEVYGEERHFTTIGGYLIPIGGKLTIKHVECWD